MPLPIDRATRADRQAERTAARNGGAPSVSCGECTAAVIISQIIGDGRVQLAQRACMFGLLVVIGSSLLDGDRLGKVCLRPCEIEITRRGRSGQCAIIVRAIEGRDIEAIRRTVRCHLAARGLHHVADGVLTGIELACITDIVDCCASPKSISTRGSAACRTHATGDRYRPDPASTPGRIDVQLNGRRPLRKEPSSFVTPEQVRGDDTAMNGDPCWT